MITCLENEIFFLYSCVMWLNSDGLGIQLDYRLICLHAISRDLNAFPHEHLLCHYVGKLPGIHCEEDNEINDDDNKDDDSIESELTIRFIPEDKDSLQLMFDALANCQTLHPDSDCQLSGDEFEDAEEDLREEFFENEEDIAHLTAHGSANLERLNNLLNVGQGDGDITARTNLLNINNGYEEARIDADQFKDADEMDQ
ncbi:Methylosome subunit pICln [Bulinus truncatus]|nr:Methylosome subunit pICln [Bulinus truncatus]